MAAALSDAILGAALKTFELNDIVATLDCTTNKYIVCSKLNAGSGEWRVTASDGMNVWIKTFNAAGVDQLIQTSDQINSLEDYLKEFKKTLETERPKISHQAEHLDIISSSGKMQWRLQKCAEQQQATELSSLLFYLAMQVQSLTKKVQTVNSVLSVPRTPAVAASLAMNLDSHRKGAANKLRHKKGMSMLNPGSKKLKGAHGVEFE